MLPPVYVDAPPPPMPLVYVEFIPARLARVLDVHRLVLAAPKPDDAPKPELPRHDVPRPDVPPSVDDVVPRPLDIPSPDVVPRPDDDVSRPAVVPWLVPNVDDVPNSADRVLAEV